MEFCRHVISIQRPRSSRENPSPLPISSMFHQLELLNPINRTVHHIGLSTIHRGFPCSLRVYLLTVLKVSDFDWSPPQAAACAHANLIAAQTALIPQSCGIHLHLRMIYPPLNLPHMPIVSAIISQEIPALCWNRILTAAASSAGNLKAMGECTTSLSSFYRPAPLRPIRCC